MEIDVDSIIVIILQIVNSFLNSGFFWFVKFILAIYVSVLFIDIVLLLVLRGVGVDIRDTIKGSQMPLASKKKIQKRWLEIENRLKLENNMQNKIAILEADKLVDEILLNIGYTGSNMKERLEKANANQIEEIDNLIEAHDVRNKIIYDDKFYLDNEESQRVIRLYREFLDNLEII
ncbi:MAG: hypothetical protein RBS77_01070 [Candidatus Moranbacteria bacterium]|jgi:hypothetical protein|nr:hypothetical protein [Candidatus Moranbacteria bacterium]